MSLTTVPWLIVDKLFNIFVIHSDPVDVPPNTHCHEERKYIIFQSSLLELFRVCRCCHGPGQTSLTEVGTYLKVIFACLECDFRLEWTSQPLVGTMPVGNLLLSAGILFTGNLLTKVFCFLDAMNIAHQSKKTFYNHQVNYLQPVIVNKWLQDQQSLRNQASLLTGGLILAGDGRSDSPGFSAKYGGFNCIKCRLNKVIDIQLVQVSAQRLIYLQGQRHMQIVMFAWKRTENSSMH